MFKKSMIKTIKEWLDNPERPPQFEILNIDGYVTKLVKRLSDGKKFKIGINLPAKGGKYNIFLFSKDKIHVEVEITEKNSNKTIMRRIKINEL